MNQHAGGARPRSDVSFKTRPKKVGGLTRTISCQSGERSIQRRRPPRGAMHFPGLDKCSVCLDPAGPHIYYGARVRGGEGRGGRYSHQSSHQACLPCRAFFKRSVEQNQVYICFGDSNCVVTFRGRKTCKYCRFQVSEMAGSDWCHVSANLTPPP